MRRRGTCYLLLSVLLLLVLAATVVACGSDDSATTTSAPTTTPPPTSAGTTSPPDTTDPGSTDTTTAPPAGEAIELKMATVHQPMTLPDTALVEWTERIKQASGGLLTIRNYNANQLMPGPEIRDGIEAGLADLGCTYIFDPRPGFEVGANLTQLVRGVTAADGVRIFDALWAQYVDVMESQWTNFKLLWIVPSIPTFLFTADTPVRTMADLKGLEIRVPNSITADYLMALGGAPVSMSAPDWITSLDKGTTDGGLTTVTNIADFQIGGKLKYCTMFPLGSSCIFLAMNKDSWNRLSPELQKIIDDSLAEARQENIDMWAKVEVEGRAYCEEKGVEFIELAPDEAARWNEAIQPRFEQMGASMDKAGYPGTEIVNFARELMSKQ